ncbi:MAG TPA: DUF4235 domain-containing protein [Solirubrobacteraceae bacterium]|jgi:hypothetical protein
MAKLFFMPFSIATGLIAGLISKRAFELIWGRIDSQDPPQPKDRKAGFGKLALSLALEGALFRVVKGLVDHSSRRGFASLTGSWPGDREPESAESESK